MFSHKLGLSRVDPEGKPCTTHFTRISYDGETSVVKCKDHYNYPVLIVLKPKCILGCPRTGRMHQIRVHLQWLGELIKSHPGCHGDCVCVCVCVCVSI